MKCKNPPNDFEKAIDENHVNIWYLLFIVRIENDKISFLK